MKNTLAFLETFYTEQLKITSGAKGETIHQTQRNSVKARLMEAIQLDLAECLEVEALRTADGIGVLMSNEEQGGVPFVLDVAMKPFNYDVYAQNDAYNIDKEIKAERAAKRARERAAKFKNDTAKREMNAKKETA